MLYPKNSFQKTEKVFNKNAKTVTELIQSRLAQKRQNQNEESILKLQNNRLSYKKQDQVLVSKQKSNKLTRHSQILNLKIKQQNSLSLSQSEYIILLEQSQCQLKNRIKILEKQIKIRQLEQKQQKEKKQKEKLKKYFYLVQLQRYYEESRKLILSCCMQLIDCKSVLCQIQNNQQKERIQSINLILNKNQVLLKSFNCHQNDFQDLQFKQKCHLMIEIKKSKQMNVIQEKIITHMKNVKFEQQKYENFEAEKRLLRFQINRVFSQNQKIKEQLKSTCVQFYENSSKNKQINNNNDYLLKQYFEIIDSTKRYQSQIQKINLDKQILEKKSQEINSNYNKLSQQFSNLKIQNQDYQKSLIQLRQKLMLTETLLQQTTSKLQQHNIKTPNKNDGTISNFASPIQFNKFEVDHNIAKLEQFLEQQNEYYAEIYQLYKKNNDMKFSQLKEIYQNEKNEKQKILQWCKKIYELLKKSELTTQEIEEHMRQLYNLEIKKKPSKIMLYLNQIQSMVLSMNYQQQKQVQNELSQYIGSLKKRNQIIQEVSNQDGSSMYFTDYRSQAFTEMQQKIQQI